MQTIMDIDSLRAETPGCRRVLHFNNAGAALMPQPVVDAVIRHTQLEAEIGGYEAARQEASAIEQVYASVARLIGAQPDEIALMQNATRAWQQIFYAMPFRPGDRILTSISEYASNYIAYLHIAQKTGAVVEAVPNDESGQLSVKALADMLDDRVRLIGITHVPTNGGLINPAEAVGQLAREAGIPYLLDACQSVGQMPLDVEKIGCDFLSATSRKYLRGPRGAGFLYVSQDYLERLEPPMLDLHAATLIAGSDSQQPVKYKVRPDAKRFETWETSYALNLGMGMAVDYALSLGIESFWPRIQALANQLRSALKEISGVQVQDLGTQQCAIVSFTLAGKAPAAVCGALAEHQVNVSWSPPEYTFLDMTSRHLTEGLVRASVHYYNTEAEIERFCALLRSL